MLAHLIDLCSCPWGLIHLWFQGCYYWSMHIPGRSHNIYEARAISVSVSAGLIDCHYVIHFRRMETWASAAWGIWQLDIIGYEKKPPTCRCLLFCTRRTEAGKYLMLVVLSVSLYVCWGKKGGSVFCDRHDQTGLRWQSSPYSAPVLVTFVNCMFCLVFNFCQIEYSE